MRHPESAVPPAPVPAVSAARDVPKRRLADESDDLVLAQAPHDEAQAEAEVPPMVDSQVTVVTDDGSRDEGDDPATVIAASADGSTDSPQFPTNTGRACLAVKVLRHKNQFPTSSPQVSSRFAPHPKSVKKFGPNPP